MIDLSYCIVNTNGRDHLIGCLDAIERTHPPQVEREILVLDNASDDGSAEAVRGRAGDVRLIALTRREGKAANDSRLLREARGRHCLLLNEDTELQDGCAGRLLEALERDPAAAVAGAQLLDSAGRPTACAWRLPDAGWALAAAVFAHRRYAVQSRGAKLREVGWVQSSAMLVRTDAARSVGGLDEAFFVYSDETDFCRRLKDSGWRVLWVPGARAVHHDQLSTDAGAMSRRIVEFHRGRDLYFRKHGMAGTALLWKACWTWAYLLRAGFALAAPGYDPSRYVLHARQQLMPGRGAGLREAAEEHNRRLASP